MSKLFLIITVF